MPRQAMVRIMFGCDKFCTYCIVPRVRGPEQSRPAAEIENEVRRLADQGCLEVTLLGQTVNSYKDTSEGRTVRAGRPAWSGLHEIDGLRRLKFVTNHPRHMTRRTVARRSAICPRSRPICTFPRKAAPNARAGADETRLHGRRATARCWSGFATIVPGAAVTSDFIVGFCGETEDDFQQTAELVRWARFKNSFIFKYSPRPGDAGPSSCTRTTCPKR